MKFKYISFRKGLVLGIIILLFGSAFAVGNVTDTRVNTNIDKQNFEEGSISEYYISIKETQELIKSQKAILLDVQDKYISYHIDGAPSVIFSDLGCGSCLENKLKEYEYIIVYSEDSKISSQASDLLRDLGYIVYELIDELPSDDFPLSYDIFDSNIDYKDVGFINEEYLPIKINGNTAHVNAYKREGRIVRLYGKAFSHGGTPEESAENFIQTNANLFGVNPEDLGDPYSQPIMYNQDTGKYKFIGLNYVQYKEDIQVFRSRLILLVRNIEGYPLVHASVDLRDLSGFTPNIVPGSLNPEEGINKALEESPNLVQFTQPELVIWAGIDDMVLEPTLAYSFIGDNGYKNGDSSPLKYLFVTGAETGDILYIENLIYFTDVTGNVQGKVTQENGADICDEELAENLMWARVNIGSTVVYADEYGNFTISNSGSSPVTVQSRLWGKWFKVSNQAGSDTVLSETVTPPGPANFMHNDENDDEYKRAEVNAYYQANIVRDFTLKYNPDYPSLDENEFQVNVNINSNCNAYYNGNSINFYRSGGGCSNTAFSTVIHHEYGHHLVAMGGSGQGQYGEGMSDVMGVLITDDSGLAYGFYSNDCDTPLRNANNTLQYPCGGAIHYCGQLLSGCVWDTRNELVETNPSNYTDILSNLAINAILLHTGTTIDPSITIDYLTLDDDNGNISDGTPHYREIAAGFGAHSMDAPPTFPRIPDAPEGPDEGIIYNEITFNATTIDYDGEQIYYMFDWGNGEDSGWLGPYNYNETSSASYIWTEEGNYEVRAKAKDESERETNWSDPHTINIYGARMEVGLITGGFFKVSTSIENTGGIEANSVQWKIKVEGNVFTGKENSGIENIPAGGDKTVTSNLILGFGPIQVTVEALIPEGLSDTRKQNGFVYLFYINVRPGDQ